MPRINIEDSLFKDNRFYELSQALGSKRMALGALVEAWILAQQYVTESNPSGMVPAAEWQKQKIPNEIIDVGLAFKKEGQIQVAGGLEQFAWLRQRQEAARLGGLAKSKKFKDKSQKLKEKKEPLPTGSNRMPKPAEICPHTLTLSHTHTLNLDPTYSKLDIKKKDLTNLVDPTCVEPKKNSVQTHTVKNKDLYFYINKKLLELYPVDYLDREKKKMEIWLAANSHKSPKSDRGMIRFVTGWLSRSWDQYRKGLNSNAPKEKTLSEALAEEQGVHGGH